ncbi:c-type cytochrome [Abyssalbus ytuae]|uniref:Cytochrome c n=1 Tax=Abyssalbus ytuae TaxID=2926907 RepID=A0A9E6ZMB2_9FLAO|nr:cytochrome c [Abyssalbus ytuae]UOB16925.1 cytochrome c [Abyssalbus ytuae]
MNKLLPFISPVFITVFCISCAQQNPELLASMERGKAVYNEFCITCHMNAGQGVENAFPPLAKSDYLLKNRKESIHLVKYGGTGTITVNGKKYTGAMTRLGLTDKEVADVLNFVMNSWGNKSPDMVTEQEVAAIKE